MPNIADRYIDYPTSLKLIQTTYLSYATLIDIIGYSERRPANAREVHLKGLLLLPTRQRLLQESSSDSRSL